MKIMNAFILAVLTMALFACKTTPKITKTIPEKVQMISYLKGCADSLTLYEFDGISFKEIKKVGTIAKDSFHLEVPAGSPRFYYLGNKDKRKRPVILGSEPVVSIKGDCRNIRSAVFLDSPMNVEYDALMREVGTHNSSMSRAAKSFQKNMRNKEKRDLAIQDMEKIDQRKIKLLDSLKQQNPYIAKVAALSTYLSFHNHNNNRHKNELDYFGREYFDFVDFKDPDYNNIPYVFEAFKIWSKTLAGQKIPKELVQSYFDSTLVQIPETSRAFKYAMGGIVTTLQAANHPLFIEYGQRYIDKYKNDKGQAIGGLRQRVKMAGSFVTGAVAPDFTQNTPEGEPLSLSDLRGKVVLVDFWASWCGPCRRANPHVVGLYEKYKDNGFDVLGVSLDKSKAPWVKAIEKDGLKWHNISDLKGWKNEVAQMYSVSSVPHTILLDREGRIIARNLRGPQLDQELEKIFGK